MLNLEEARRNLGAQCQSLQSMLCDAMSARGAWHLHGYQTKEHKCCMGALFTTNRSVHVFSMKLVAKHQLLIPNLSRCSIRLYGVVVVGALSMAYIGGSSPLWDLFRENVRLLLRT